MDNFTFFEFFNSNILTNFLLVLIFWALAQIGKELSEKLKLLQNINNAVWRTADKLNPDKD